MAAAQQVFAHLQPSTQPASNDSSSDDFEFRISSSTNNGSLLTVAPNDDHPNIMCSADEVFFRGQILPLRPSLSSDNGLFISCSESMDRSHCNTVLSSNTSSSRSSSCVSRSQSSNSGCSDHHSLVLSNNIIFRASPKPHFRHNRKSPVIAGGRKSTGSAPPGWRILQLGVVKAPEIELQDLKSRWQSSGNVSGRKSNAESTAKKEVSSSAVKNCNVKFGDHVKFVKSERKVTEVLSRRSIGRRFVCRCSPDVVEPPAMTGKALKSAEKRKKSEFRCRKSDSKCRSRIFEWLEELSIVKTRS